MDDHADLTSSLVIEYERPEHRATAALEEAKANIRDAIARNHSR